MIRGMLALLTCQLIGEWIVHALGLIIPGPVIGMILLFLGLLLYKGIPEPIEYTANALIKYIALLFVPAGVGVALYLDLIIEEWFVIIVASMGSTALTLLSVCYVFAFLSKKEAQ